MGFYSLPTDKLTKKTKNKKLKNFRAGYVGSFYRNLDDNVDTFMGSDFYGRIAKDSKFPQKIFKNISSQPVIFPKECKQI